MHLRHLIVLIIDARNSGRALVRGHLSLGSNDRPRLETTGKFDRSDQKTKIHVRHSLLPGVRVKQGVTHLFTMSKDPARRPLDGRLPAKLCSLFDEATIGADRLVEPDGIEPTTSCLQSTRSPN